MTSDSDPHVTQQLHTTSQSGTLAELDPENRMQPMSTGLDITQRPDHEETDATTNMAIIEVSNSHIGGNQDVGRSGNIVLGPGQVWSLISIQFGRWRDFRVEYYGPCVITSASLTMPLG